MSTMIIFDPAMCCSTGICGVSVDPELLRISAAINKLISIGIEVKRFNPNTTPEAFITNNTINNLISSKGIGVLPITLVNNKIVKMGSYLTNEELSKIFNLSKDILNDTGTKTSNRNNTIKISFNNLKKMN